MIHIYKVLTGVGVRTLFKCYCRKQEKKPTPVRVFLNCYIFLFF
jgi:hypothetical protein